MNKVIFYSWDKVAKQCEGNISCMLKIFDSFVYLPVPRNLLGTSFIINLKELLNSLETDATKIEYLYLASLRNYFDYKYQNDAGLYLYFSDLSSDRLKANKLLNIQNEHIKFKYEENYGN